MYREVAMDRRVKSAITVSCLLFAPIVSFGDSNSVAAVSLELDGKTLGESINAISNQTGRTYIFNMDIGARTAPDIQLNAVPADVAIAVIAAAYQVCSRRLEGPGNVTGIFACRDPELPAS